MKRFASLILTLLIAFSIPVSASAAKPSGGGSTATEFISSIKITPLEPLSINANESLTLTAAWTASPGITRTEWYVDGSPQAATLKSFRSDTTSGSSTFTFASAAAGEHKVKFRIWKYKDSTRDASSEITVTVNAQAPTVINYVSLGDSIATGTTSPLTANTNPYTDQFQTFLKSTGATVIRSEFETDGDRTNELYDKLGLGDKSPTAVTNQAMINAVTNADVITVSIGGYNLMQACATGLWYKPYDFFKPNVTLANKGYDDFMDQFDDIMSRIRTLNSDAVVIVLTLYNPYNTGDTYMHNLVDGYYIKDTGNNTDGMNDQIKIQADAYNYRVADVYTKFDQYRTNMAAVTLLYPSSLTRNPHPNQTGQNYIRDLNIAQY